jgi:hypothetical protein
MGMSGVSWTADELSLLRRAMAKHLVIDDVTACFSHRTAISVRTKASRLGLHLTGHIPWTKRETKRIRAFLDGQFSRDQLMASLPGRTKKAIDSRIIIVRRQSGRSFVPGTWTTAEVGRLVAALENGLGGKDLHLPFPQRNPASVDAMAYRLRLKHHISSRQVTRQQPEKNHVVPTHARPTIRADRPDAGACHEDAGTSSQANVDADNA